MSCRLIRNGSVSNLCPHLPRDLLRPLQRNQDSLQLSPHLLTLTYQFAHIAANLTGECVAMEPWSVSNAVKKATMQEVAPMAEQWPWYLINLEYNNLALPHNSNINFVPNNSKEDEVKPGEAEELGVVMDQGPKSMG